VNVLRRVRVTIGEGKDAREVDSLIVEAPDGWVLRDMPAGPIYMRDLGDEHAAIAFVYEAERDGRLVHTLVLTVPPHRARVEHVVAFGHAFFGPERLVELGGPSEVDEGYLMYQIRTGIDGPIPGAIPFTVEGIDAWLTRELLAKGYKRLGPRSFQRPRSGRGKRRPN
jgi:hypothetical protein